MLQLQFPEHKYRIKKEGSKHVVFDEVRRRWVTLSPEEWVRQNFIQYLVKVKGYPPSLISVEKLIKLGELNKRYDIVVYRNSSPWMVVECKETNTALTAAVIDQVLNYNMALAVQYLVITNGNQSYGYKIRDNAFLELDELPAL